MMDEERDELEKEPEFDVQKIKKDNGDEDDDVDGEIPAEDDVNDEGNPSLEKMQDEEEEEFEMMENEDDEDQW